jgi:hypothetical protein
MTYARKVDSNQPEIVGAFRDMGASVLHLHAVGRGCPDLLIGWRGDNFLVEVKDGSGLTNRQKRFHAEWMGRPVSIVTSVDDVLRIMGAK